MGSSCTVIDTPKQTYGVVYKISNSIDGKKYIGLTTAAIKRRLQKHWCVARSGEGQALHEAMRAVIGEYGDENAEQYFGIEIVEHCSSREELNRAEAEWVAREGAREDTGWGYNLTDGGGGGRAPSARTRTKMAASQRNRPPITEEARVNKRQAQKRRWSRPEERQAQSLRVRERFSHSEARDAHKLRMTEITSRPEWRMHVLTANIAYWSNPESHQKQSLLMIQKLADPTIRTHMSEGQKNRLRRQTPGPSLFMPT